MRYKHDQTHQSPAEEAAAEQVDIKNLVKTVEESFASMAKLTKLPVQEVLHIVEEVDVAQLTRASNEAIHNISVATGLHRDPIIAIFLANRAASMEDIAQRLHDESKVWRQRF